MKKCFDAGTIQAFLDGELGEDSQESVARHIAACDSCALALSEAEEETAFAFAALEQEFNALVPTNRLWTKINDSIERESSKSIRQTVFANIKSLIANPSIAVFAAILLVAGIFLAVRHSGTSESENYISREIISKQEIVLSKQTSAPKDSLAKSNLPQIENVAVKSSSSAREANSYRIVKTNFVIEKNRRKVNQNPAKEFSAPKTIAPEFVSGEQTYIRTIATLEKTVNSRKDEVLKPAARFSFEKDLAVADDAIAKMKTEIRQNPKNETAKQVLLSSYQNKVDLLNSVAEKTELMASLK